MNCDNLQIVVYDNVLNDDDRNFILKEGSLASADKKETLWSDFTLNDKIINSYHKLIYIAKNNFNLSSMVGYEYWFHFKSRPQTWHQDLHEDLFKSNKTVKTSLVSIVYYPLIENVKNGNFLTENGITVQPKTNRLIIFKGNLLHLVEEFTGNRNSIAINVWDEKIKEYKKNVLLNLKKSLKIAN